MGLALGERLRDKIPFIRRGKEGVDKYAATIYPRYTPISTEISRGLDEKGDFYKIHATIDSCLMIADIPLPSIVKPESFPDAVLKRGERGQHPFDCCHEYLVYAYEKFGGIPVFSKEALLWFVDNVKDWNGFGIDLYWNTLVDPAGNEWKIPNEGTLGIYKPRIKLDVDFFTLPHLTLNHKAQEQSFVRGLDEMIEGQVYP